MSPVPDLPDPDAVAAAVATCPSVAGLSGGFAGEVATYLPGRRVAGVRTSEGSVEVHVVARYGQPLATVDAEVRAAVSAAVAGPLDVRVVLADVEDPFTPDEPEPEPPALPEAPSTVGVATPGRPAGPSAPPLPAAPAP